MVFERDRDSFIEGYLMPMPSDTGVMREEQKK